ncbi:MFS transporter [Pseudoduganella sp. UC29_106]|uniref:MFS transporter n=1 Tax=Pseudoduganella sp. UC29_106 TaxID=3374553 RepID=UPI00375781F5
MDKRLLFLASGMFALGTDSFVVAGILAPVAASLHISVSLAGQMVTIYALSYALLSPVIAAAAANWPRKQLLLAGLAVFVLGNVITAIAPNIELVLASRFLAGLGAAMFSPTATAAGAALVPAEQRGRALAIVVAGLSSATALGAPLGTYIGGLFDWRATMWFVSAIGALAFIGLATLLPAIPTPPAVSLKRRLEPLGDARVLLTLLTTGLVYSGVFLVYTYISLVFDRATGGNGSVLSALLLTFGVASLAGNLLGGRLTDRFGNRPIINIAIIVLVVDFVLLPWTSASLPTAAVALVVWGVAGWGMIVPQQHRLIGTAPSAAPLLLGLNAMALYIGVSMSGLLGGAVIKLVNAHSLGLVSAVFIGTALFVAEAAQRRIAGSTPPAAAVAG